MTRWEARLLLVNCSMCKHYMHSEQNDIDGLNCFADHHIAREQGNAWYGENAGSKTHPVGQKKANNWGLFDMSGNVWEWCEDSWHKNYENAPTDGTVWNDNHSQSASRVIRGGSWYNNPWDCRSAYRLYLTPDDRGNDIGFRVVCAVRGSV